MPNRIIKESIKRSEQIDKLSWFEEVVYYRLIVSADDFGICDGRTVLLKNELFPLKENVTKKAVEDAIDNLVKVGLLSSYEVSDIPYLAFPTWKSHQRIRNKRHKYPMPDNDNLTATCGQLTADCQSESESNLNPNLNPNSNSLEEPDLDPDDNGEIDNSEIARQVIDYLNQATGSHYKYVTSNIKSIAARLNDGYTLADCKTVIDKKCAEWINDEKMCQYLKPDTLFRPGHFDTYLNQPTAATAKKNGNWGMF